MSESREYDAATLPGVKVLAVGAPVSFGGNDFMMVPSVPPAAVTGMSPNDECQFTLSATGQLFVQPRPGSKGVFINGVRADDGALAHVADPAKAKFYIGGKEAPIALAPVTAVEKDGVQQTVPLKPMLLLVPGFSGPAATVVRLTSLPPEAPGPASLGPQPPPSRSPERGRWPGHRRQD